MWTMNPMAGKACSYELNRFLIPDAIEKKELRVILLILLVGPLDQAYAEESWPRKKN